MRNDGSSGFCSKHWSAERCVGARRIYEWNIKASERKERSFAGGSKCIQARKRKAIEDAARAKISKIRDDTVSTGSGTKHDSCREEEASVDRKMRGCFSCLLWTTRGGGRLTDKKLINDTPVQYSFYSVLRKKFWNIVVEQFFDLIAFIPKLERN